MKRKIGSIRSFLDRHVYLGFLFESVLLTMFIELISRKSFFRLARFIGGSQLTFLCNVFIVFLTLSLSMLAGSRRRFLQAFITILWLVLGGVNAIVLRYRMTPFSAEDFSMIPSLIRIADNYMTAGTLMLIAAAVLLLLGSLILLWRKLPRDSAKKNWLLMVMRTMLIALGCYLFLDMGMQTQAISTDFMNLADAYEEYGFAYCFSTSIVDVGIDEPEEYGPELLQNIADGIEEGESLRPETLFSVSSARTQSAGDSTKGASSVSASVETETQNVKPNIIMIQLESFFDPVYLKQYSCSEDPIPNFRSIKENYASGFLTVPVVGAGTANTEFEILTGMSSDYFGAGEYPYNTVLKDTTVEAMPQILRQYGYTSTAIHNNTGTFYNRDIVFSHMGFDCFIPEEFMYDLEDTPTNWHKDNVLPDIITDVLAQSEGPDFIYTITVQSHGRYPNAKVLEDPAVTVSGGDETANVNAVEYYVNMIHEVDEMIGDLADRLSQSEEPTVLVMYGDHLPALGFDADDLSQPSLYQTEYVVWNNFGLVMEDRDIQAESIGTGILQAFGLDDGIIPKFHEVYDGTQEYEEYLKTLEYDMLYGDGYVFTSFGEGETEDEGGPVRAYQPTELRFGYRAIRLTGAEVRTDGLYVYGENFNLSSRIVIDGKVKDTEYVDEGTLVLRDVPKTAEELHVGQFDENLKQLGAGTDSLIDVIREQETPQI